MKVTIIGASVSGLFLAYLLAKEGVEVEIFEKEENAHGSLRTLIVTSKIYEAMEFIPEESILNKIKHLELSSRSQTLRLELKDPDLVIERGRLLSLLAHLAEEAGAKILFRHRFEGFAQFGKKTLVSLRNLKINEPIKVSTDVLVGADGALSTVGRFASLDGHPLVTLLQARVTLPQSMSADTTQIWFRPDQTKYFYWLIPESDRTAAVGLIANDSRQAEACLTEFLQSKDLEPFEFQSALVPMHRFRYGGDVLSEERNVFAVGDAAAQVKVTTVGGVVTGLHGARALTDAILNGRNYPKALRKLKIELNLHLLIRQILNRFSGEDYDQLIGMIHGRLKETLEEWNRDELTQSFLRLIWTEPRLIKLGAKALLKSFL